MRPRLSPLGGLAVVRPVLYVSPTRCAPSCTGIPLWSSLCRLTRVPSQSALIYRSLFFDCRPRDRQEGQHLLRLVSFMLWAGPPFLVGEDVGWTCGHARTCGRPVMMVTRRRGARWPYQKTVENTVPIGPSLCRLTKSGFEYRLRKNFGVTGLIIY